MILPGKEIPETGISAGEMVEIERRLSESQAVY